MTALSPGGFSSSPSGDPRQRLLRGFGFGLAGTYETMSTTNTAGLPSNTGGSLPGYFTDGQQQFFAYNPADKAVVVRKRRSLAAYPRRGITTTVRLGCSESMSFPIRKSTRTAVAPYDSAHLRNTAWEV